MRPIIESLAYPGVSSIRCGEYVEYDFDYPFHIHPEFEFTCMIEGQGRQIIGDDISQYQSGELIFIGPNLPHSWQIDYDKKKEKRPFRLINLQFREDSLGADFFTRPEMSGIKHLLDTAKYGMVILGKTRRQITSVMQSMVKEQGFGAILALLHILDLLSRSQEYRICSSLGYIPTSSSPQEMERIRVVHQYVMEHYREAIDLGDISKQLGMTKSAFCHYFKKRTGRAFVRYVHEMRIRYACRLLQESPLNITNICFESGFNNLSLFNRVFQRVMHTTPRSYRKTAQI